MPRGGKRPGAGSKPTWKHGKTKTIRVPIALVDEILELARKLDMGEITDYDTISKVIDLSGITIPKIRGRSFVFLEDLVRSGYEIRPRKLADGVIDEIYKSQLTRYDT